MGIDSAPAAAAAERVLERPLPIDPGRLRPLPLPRAGGGRSGWPTRRRSSCARRPARGARPTRRWSTGTGPIAIADSRTLVVPMGELDPDLESDVRATGATLARPGGRAARLARPRPPARDRARARPRPRPDKPPQSDTIGGAPMRRSLLLVAARAARPRRRLRRLGLRLVERRPGQHRALARLRRRRGQGARSRGEALQRDAPQDPRHRPELRQRRLRPAEGADGDPRRLLPRHRLPVRLVGREHGPHAQGGRRRSAHQGRPVDQLERLLARRAPGRDRRRQDRRRPGARRQPRPRLQQEALRSGRHGLPDRRLDVGRLPRGGQAAHRPVGEAVRLGVRERRERGHGVALRRAALAGRRRHPDARPEARGVQLPGRRRGGDPAPADGRPSTTPSTSTAATATTPTSSTRARSACSSPGRGTSPGSRTSTTASRSSRATRTTRRSRAPTSG